MGWGDGLNWRENLLPLQLFLETSVVDEHTLSIAQINQILGFDLNHAAGTPGTEIRWWYGERSHVRAWEAIGWTAQPDLPHSVTFRRR